MMKIIKPMGAIAIFLLLASGTVLGCECMPAPLTPPTPEEARAALIKDYNGAFAIFSGKVIALDRLRVKFKVDKLWKGDFGDEITMSTGTRVLGTGGYVSSSCDYNFRPGGEYLVYAYGDNAEEMQARECTRTGKLKDAEKEMKELDEVWPHEKRNQEPKGGN